MKKIKIFLASSITDLRIDRLEVGDFIRQLNDVYFDRGVQFFLGKCEDFDNAIAADGKQTEFDQEIRDSELCFFLFFKKVGDYTRHEFEVALEAFRNCKKPKIVTYFKYVESPDEAQGEVRAFMQMLDGEIKHYYNIYQNIDTLKLGILMQIKLMGLDAEEPKVENGKIVFGGQTIAETSALPIFTGNRTLAGLKNDLKTLTAKYYELRERLSENLEDEAAEEEYRKVANERAETEQALRAAEKGVLEAMKSMLERTSKGNLSARQVAAYRAFEHGNYQDALEILDFNEIMSELSHNEAMAEGYTERIQVNVNELMQRIEVLKADGVDKDEAVEIAQIYETVKDRVEKYNLEKYPLYDYAEFLYRQTDYQKAIEVIKQFQYYCSDPKSPADDLVLSAVWNLLGLLYATARQYEEADSAYRNAIECGKRLVEKEHSDTGLPESRLAITYGNYGGMCLGMQRFPESERAYLASIEILRGIEKKDPAEYTPYLSAILVDYGMFCYNVQRYAEAERVYLEALENYTALVKKNPAEHEPRLASAYDNLSLLYSMTSRYAEAKEASEKAAEIYGRLAERNPAAYEPLLAKNKLFSGGVYENMQKYAEALAADEAAIVIYRRLAKKNPGAFELLLAYAYLEAGEIYGVLSRTDEARKANEIAVELMERHSAEGETYMLAHLALGYSGIANVNYQTERYTEAEQMSKKAIAVYERLVQENFAAYGAMLAMCYNNLGLTYGEMERPEAAMEVHMKALKLYERMAEQNPEAFEPDIAMSCFNYGLSCEDVRYDEAQEYYARAYRIAKKYPQNEVCANIVSTIEEVYGEL